VVRDVEVRNVTAKKAQYALLLRGYGHDPIRDVRVVDCAFDEVAKPDLIEGVEGLVLANTRINGQLRNERITR
jgi:hypothetical protein